MSNHKYDTALLWDRINGGLTFFQDEFSSEISANGGKIKGFRVRPVSEDKTGSCHIHKSAGSKQYFFRDWGTMEKGVNAIDYVMLRDNCDFHTACKTLFTQYQLATNSFDYVKSDTKFSSKVEKEKGYFNIEAYDKIQDPKYFKTIVPFYTEELLQEYDFKELKSYEYVGQGDNGKFHLINTSYKEYPIYGYDKKEFCKLYQPKAFKGKTFPDGTKNHDQKHSFVGNKPERIIYGWDRLFDLVDIHEIEDLLKQISKEKDTKSRNRLLAELNELKLDSVFICTGGTDGLNIASLGHNVIWFNSETEIITKDELFQLQKICKIVYYIPDLDKTGIKQAVKMGLMSKNHLAIKMVWLPEWLKMENKKDAADWIRKQYWLHQNIEIAKASFNQLLSQALEFKFWVKNDKNTLSIQVKNMLQFLKYNGFYRYKIENKSADNTKKIQEVVFIRLQNNIATQVFPSDIKDFVVKWLEDNYIDIKVQNMIIKSVFFSERSSLMSLPITELNTKTGTQDTQLYFFNNSAVKVSKTNIELLNYEASNTVVWDSNVIKRDFKLQDQQFRIFTNDAGKLDIEIFSNASNYLKVLIQTSRVFWRKDLDKNNKDTNSFNITSDKLTDAENEIQKLQLINKIFCAGHLLHRYKIKSKTYLILGIDRKIGKNAKDNNGGSGKTFFGETLYHYIQNYHVIDGRNIHKDDNKFMLDGVTKETDIISVSDLSPYYDFNSFFNYVDNDMTANHKGGKMHKISFDDFAKVWVTMNAVPYEITSSLQRRMVTYECCDLYHEIGPDYTETRTIASDFGGRVLFDSNYSKEEWQNDDNFVMQALQFYLTQDHKIEVEQGNLMLRNLLQQIGDRNLKFFEKVFSDESEFENISHKDTSGKLWVHKKGLFDFYREELGSKAATSQDFKDLLELYFSAKNYNFVLAKKKLGGTGNSVEHYYFSKEEIPVIENDVDEKIEVPVVQTLLDYDDIKEPDESF